MDNLKVGDKVRIRNINEPIGIYGYSVGDIVEVTFIDPPTLIIEGDDNSPQIVKLTQLEKLRVEKAEPIGYTIVTANHFGNSGKYSWLCDRELYKDIELNDLVLVDTTLGERVVQVVKKSETLDIKRIHKKVIKKLEVY